MENVQSASTIPIESPATLKVSSAASAGNPVQTIPRQLGRYRLVEKIGEGGTANIFSAHYSGPLGFKLPVAVKVAKPGHGERLFEEARMTATFRHPNVVQVFDIGREQEYYYYAMERIDGATLRDLIRTEARLPLTVCFDLASQICDALQSLHAKDPATQSGIFHGDLKPSNVMVQPNGRLKLIDFGIAGRFGPVTDSYGTPAYMAPEQLSDHVLDAKTDIFTLGAVLFEIFTGERLFTERDIPRLIVERADVDRTLDLRRVTSLAGARCPRLPPLLFRCLRGRRAERYPSIQSLRKELTTIQSALPTKTSVRTWWKNRA